MLICDHIYKRAENSPVVPLFVFIEGTFPLTLIISYHVTTSCFLFLNVIYYPPPPNLSQSCQNGPSVPVCCLHLVSAAVITLLQQQREE